MVITYWKRVACAAVFAVTPLLMTACGDVYSRDEFVTAVMGKSEDTVSQKFGKPASVDASSPERVIWIYRRETFDLNNQNRRDSKTIVIFEEHDGERMVTKVEFS